MRLKHQLAIAVALLGLWVGTAAVAASVEQAVKLTDLTKPVQVNKKAPVVTILLKSNRTTGYSWFLKSYDRHLLTPMSASYVAPNKKMPGAPGYAVWKFHVRSNAFIVPRVTHIVMLYARPWSLEQASEHTLKLVIQ